MTIEKKWESLVENAENLARFARDWRNLRIAHRDLNNATGSRPCATATLADVAHAASAIGIAVDALSPDGVQTLWNVDLYKRDTEMMMHYLSEGERSDSSRHKAYVEGKLPWGKMWWDPDD